MITVDFIGDKLLVSALKQMGARLEAKVLKGASRKAARPTVLGARQKIRKRSGTLSRSIGTDVFVGEKTVRGVGKVGERGAVTVRIGPRISGQHDGFYGVFVEMGTRHAAPHPFLRPAFDANVQNALGILRNESWERIEKEAKRAAARRRP